MTTSTSPVVYGLRNNQGHVRIARHERTSLGLGRSSALITQSDPLQQLTEQASARDSAEVTGRRRSTSSVSSMKMISQDVVDNVWFEASIEILVVLDVALIALEIDYRDQAIFFFDSITLVFNAAFVAELMLRIFAKPKDWYRDRHLLFDMVLVLISLADVLAFVKDLGQIQTMDFSVILVLRVFRLIRMMRVAKLIGRHKHLVAVTEAMKDSLEVLLYVSIIACVCLFAMALMVTMLVPELLQAVNFDDDSRRFILDYWGSIARTTLSLTSALSGCEEWTRGISLKGVDLPFDAVLTIAIVVMFYFVLSVTITGLVTGVFLQILMQAMHHEEEKAFQEAVKEGNAMIRELQQEFERRDYELKDQVEWRQLRKFMIESAIPQKFGVPLEKMDAVVEELDLTREEISLQNFLFLLLKVRTMSNNRSCDMMSIDYQQERSLRQIADLNDSLRRCTAKIQSLLGKISTDIPWLMAAVRKACDGIQEVAQLEAELIRKKQIVERGVREPQVESDEEETYLSSAVLCLQSDYELQRELSDLEKATACLGSAQTRPSGAAVEKMGEDELGALADAIVESIQVALQKELGTAQAEAGLRAARLSAAANNQCHQQL